MALTGFILVATETMPAGLLPQIASGMAITEGGAGQYVSAWALGTVIFAIPAVTLTRSRHRKPLLLVGLAVMLLATVVTSISTNFIGTLIARFIAGIFAGLLWGILAGYARRISPPALAGRALAIASIGTPLGLAIGTPLGSWFGINFGWRWTFGGMAVLTAIALLLAVAFVPNAPGQRAESRLAFHRILALPGVSIILAVIFLWMLAHNTMYTYYAAYLRSGNTGLPIDVAFVTFGLAALAGIWITGAIIDRALRPLVLASITLFVVAGLVFLIGYQSLVAVFIAVVLWGVSFGGAAAQFQTAIGEAAGENGDVANALLGVSWNLAIFAAGVLGAILITAGVDVAITILMIVLPLIALAIAAVARRSAFPVGR
jgi:predicted MFS family arabinose efflux permease